MDQPHPRRFECQNTSPGFFWEPSAPHGNNFSSTRTLHGIIKVIFGGICNQAHLLPGAFQTQAAPPYGATELNRASLVAGLT